MHYSGAQILLKLLERQGIRTISGIPGGTNLPIYDALRDSPIRHVLARHEQGAGFIGQGMARASGKPAVCFATSGPGATNLLTAIADAKLDSIPLIAITGQVSSALIGTDAFQEIDTYGLTLPITKHNFLVRSAAELLEVVPAAFRIATSGRPGPVAIDIPKDVQIETIQVDTWPQPGQPEPLPVLAPEGLEQIIELLSKAQRPLLYAGGGIIAAGAADSLRSLCEHADLPCAVTLMGLGALPTNHSHYLGMLGMHGARYTNLALEECDLLIAAGVRFDDRATGLAEQFCPQAKIIHIDIDASELAKIRPPDLSLTGDVAQTLADLRQLLPRQNRPEWRRQLTRLKTQHPLVLPGDDDLTRPYGAILTVASLLDETAIITTDVGQHQMWTAQAFPFRGPRQWLTSGGLGTMGFGLPAAIGAALACPERQVVCFSGDGSLLMNLQEMATLAEENLNLKIVLLNNRQLGLVRQQQDLFFSGRHSASIFRGTPDFPALAAAFGLPACDLENCAAPRELLHNALRQPGPGLIHIPIAQDEKVFPMVPPGAANRDMIGGYADAC